MRVLLLTSEHEDYLEDSIIHGFKQILGVEAFDFPLKSMVYVDYKDRGKIRGGGFSLYGLIDKELKSKVIVDVEAEIKDSPFDAIIFCSISRQYELYCKLYPYLKKNKERVLIMDGQDADVIFPFFGRFIKKLSFWLTGKPHNHFIYLKREITYNTIASYHYRLLPEFISKRIKLNKNIYPISFSFPLEKIIKYVPKKVKMFTAHIVDSEVADKVSDGNTKYVFSSEEEYYNDIQISKFGITTKRDGWDCLRHYEIAANGAIICFKELDLKPKFCAPHGLVNGHNCISYTNYFNLIDKISAISEDEYEKILSNSLSWIKSKSTVATAHNLIDKFILRN